MMKSDQATEAVRVRPSSRGGAVALAVLAALAVGVTLFVRVAPLIERGERLRWQCVSEDGYLMLTIARNLALGNGFSISEGTIPSNGVQPLATLLFAGCIRLAGGDRLAGLYPVVGVQVLLSIITAFLIYALTRRVLYRGPRARMVALIAATLWFTSPTSVMHSQNGLETGLCAALILLSIGLYDLFLPRFQRVFDVGRCLLLGVAFGLTFLGRNDACFLIAAILLVHLLVGRRNGCFRRALGQASLIGATSVLVSVPWLWFNVSKFGHIIPVSGRAEALNVSFAHNFRAAFPSMMENLFLVIRLPGTIQDHRLTVALSVLCLVGVVAAGLKHRRWLSERFSAGMGALAMFVMFLFVYYALFFGMPSFLGRYFFPAVTLAAVVLAGLCLPAVSLASGVVSTRRAMVLTMAAAALVVALNARIYANGSDHLHAQIVKWVDENVPEETWVGAVQSGTLGYYHDRTINLDGKVDPGALAARRENRIPEYAIEREVEYIIDWVGITDWMVLPTIKERYELLLEDREENLAVLKRKDIGSPAPAKAASRGS